jgi:hypothetical protein
MFNLLPRYFNILIVDGIIFTIAFNVSQYFLRTTLFSDQEIKMKLNEYVFSGTFSLCMIMLALFIQDVWDFHDTTSS